MSGELDAAGTAIEGALLGAAVEPSQGGAGTNQTGACLNCGASLSGPYCAVCGQKAQVHRTLSAIWHDILHSVLHFDGKLWRTLPMLLFKPGELTRRYVLGERAKFVSPMALFLFSIFLMFAVFSFSGGSAVQNNWQRGAQEEAAKLDKEIAATGQDYYAHKMGFTPRSLVKFVVQSGFKYYFSVMRGRPYETGVLAFKSEPNAFQRKLLGLDALIADAQKQAEETQKKVAAG